MTKKDYTDEGIIKRWKGELKKKKEDRIDPITSNVLVPDLKSLKEQIRELEFKNEKLSLLEGIINRMIEEEKLEISKPNEVLFQCQKERIENNKIKDEFNPIPQAPGFKAADGQNKYH